jgi:hypothetical protein
MLNKIVELIRLRHDGITINGYIPGYGTILNKWYPDDQETLNMMNDIRKSVKLRPKSELPESWKNESKTMDAD